MAMVMESSTKVVDLRRSRIWEYVRDIFLERVRSCADHFILVEIKLCNSVFCLLILLRLLCALYWAVSGANYTNPTRCISLVIVSRTFNWKLTDWHCVRLQFKVRFFWWRRHMCDLDLLGSWGELAIPDTIAVTICWAIINRLCLMLIRLCIFGGGYCGLLVL